MRAARDGVQGKVWIQLLISETGDVEKAEIISGQPDLARAVQEAMKKWKFKPYIHNGKPVKVSTKMPFDFAFQNKVTDVDAPPDSSANAPASLASAAGTSPEGSGGYAAQKIRVSSGLAEGLKVHDVQPIYPLEARRSHLQGEVLLQATIGKDGLIHDLKVVKGDPILADAAKGAVEQWRYRPYVLEGHPVEVETTIKVIFHM
jgi:TonB family protein